MMAFGRYVDGSYVLRTTRFVIEIDEKASILQLHQEIARRGKTLEGRERERGKSDI